MKVRRAGASEPIPLVDLKSEYKGLSQEINAAVKTVLQSGRFLHGAQNSAFCREFSSYCGAAYAVGTANGTDALWLTLRALGAGPGNEVITPTFTFIATGEAIMNVGAVPVFVDVDEATFCINPEQAESKLTPKTKAVLPVHLYGQTAEMQPITRAARAKGVAVIEDACQAHGAEYRRKKAGSLGNIACFSFYPSKNLGAYGDAGAITTDNEDLAQRVALIANHGSKQRYKHIDIGTNSRLDEFQAAILRVKLKRLDSWNMSRRKVRGLYEERLRGVGDITLPIEAPGRLHVFHAYVIRTSRRDGLRDFLLRQEIAVQVYYPEPLHLMKPFQSLGYKPGSFPVAERLCREVLALPIFPAMKVQQTDRVAEAIRKFFR